MKAVLSLGLWAAILATAYGWAKYLDNYDSPSRRSYNEDECVSSGGKCYSSEQCCRHFVCAAFDDLFGLNPEVPGFCVREKDLHPCQDDMECAMDSKCMGLGRGGSKYCVVVPEEGPAKPAAPPKAGSKYRSYPEPKGQLADNCESSSDCSDTTSDGKDRLCCQQVKRYRQKARTICDRVTPISTCLP